MRSSRHGLLCAALIIAVAGEASAQQPRNPALAARVLQIADSSRRVTTAILGDAKGPKFMSPEDGHALRATEQWVTTSIKAILDSVGAWPGKSAIGDSASYTLSRLFLQTRDLMLQERAVTLLEKAVAAGDASPLGLAFLTDRARIAAGRQQVYGTALTMTQFGTAVVAPIADSASVDARRRSVGLGPLADSARAIVQPKMPPGVQVVKPPVSR